MYRHGIPRTNRAREMRLILGWLVMVALGIGLLLFGFWLGRTEEADRAPAEEAVVEGSVTAEPTEPAPLAVVSPPRPTATPAPPPTDTPVPTPAPPRPTPYIVAGADGVNVRTGPDTDYSKLGYIDPGGEAVLVDDEGDWWKIRFDDVEAYVYSPLVTGYNRDSLRPTAAAPTPEAQTSAAGASGWADEVFQRINEIRAQNDLPPYSRNPLLEQAALLHAQDTAQRGELTHIGSDGSQPSTRVERTGYAPVGVSEITVTGNSVEEAINWWMDEQPPNDPHRSAILSDSYLDIGVAVVEAGHTHYFVAVLAQPQ
jgi:uncharacterized protein YkwD